MSLDTSAPKPFTAKSTIELRSDETTWLAMRLICDRPDFQEAMNAILMESPARTLEVPPNADPMISNNLYWRNRGYEECWEKVRSLRLPWDPPKDPPETFTDPQELDTHASDYESLK